MFSALGNKLKGMVYDDVVPVIVQPTATPQAGIQAMTQLGGQALGAISTSLNADMVAMIKKVTFGRNTAFTQLLQASESLADVIPDAVMRLKAAHKTAGGGRTGRQIADAVDVHLQDVDGEEMRFKAVVEQNSKVEVGALETQAQTAQDSIVGAQAEIQKAQQLIADLTGTITQQTQVAAHANAEVVQKRAELDAAQNQFKLAAQAVRNELNGSKAAILSTLV